MVISYHGSTWRKQHLGVSTALLQFEGVEITLEFPAAASVVEFQDYRQCMCRIAINLRGIRRVSRSRHSSLDC